MLSLQVPTHAAVPGLKLSPSCVHQLSAPCMTHQRTTLPLVYWFVCTPPLSLFLSPALSLSLSLFYAADSSTMSAQELARKYGYAESHPTLYTVPQIGQLLARSELNEMEAFRRACTGGDHLFYGDGGEAIGHGASFTVP